MEWVGFTTEDDGAERAETPLSGAETSTPIADQKTGLFKPVAAGLDRQRSRAAAEPSAGRAHIYARPRQAPVWLADAARRLRQLSSSLRRLLRIAAVAATMGAVAVLAYQGGERLAGLVGASAPAAPVHPGAALAASESDRQSPARGDPTGTRAERAAYYLVRARTGDPAAQYDIAVLYARGDGLAQDFAKAAAWFREAASTGYAAAEFNLAVMYERGLGVAQNLSEALVWYRRAAAQHYPPAQYNLAVAYAEGRGIAQDPVAAAGWYRRAAVRGLIPAMINLAIAYERGEGIEPSLPNAYAWYRAAARGGDATAERRANALFRQFSGPEKAEAVIAASKLTGIAYRAATTTTEAVVSPRPAMPPTRRGEADRSVPAAKSGAAHPSPG